MEQIATDTKKEFAYDKSTGLWAWFDKDESDRVDVWHGGHKTRFDALTEAVEPYL